MAETETQTTSVLSSGTQTDPPEMLSDQVRLDAELPAHIVPGLLDFLRRVEQPVISELVKNVKSHAFNGYDVNWLDQNQTVRF